MLFVIAIIITSGCADKEESSGEITLEGTVTHGSYYYTVLDFKELESQYQFDLVAVTDKSPAPYDEIKVVFDPGKGEGSLLEANQKAEDASAEHGISIELGESTQQLIEDSEGRTIVMHIGFFKEGQLIDSFAADLPTITRKNGELAQLEAGETGTLTFRRE